MFYGSDTSFPFMECCGVIGRYNIFKPSWDGLSTGDIAENNAAFRWQRLQDEPSFKSFMKPTSI